jgi:hypothetical protein
MALKLIDKNKKLFTYRPTQSGAVLTKGRRTLYLTFMSVNDSKKAKESIAKNSFDKLYNKGRKVKLLGSNVSAIDFRK